MQFESTAWWLFPDALPKEGSLFEFCELQPYGKKGQVIIWLGKVGERVGDWKTFPSKIINLNKFVKIFGSDESKWTTKRFKLKPTEDMKSMSIELLEFV